jgi:hypothetical protein
MMLSTTSPKKQIPRGNMELSVHKFISLWGIFLLLNISVNAQRKGFNYDESKVPKYTLPELLKTQDGRKVKTSDEWKETRRSEVLTLFEDHVFGKSPGKPDSMTFKVTKTLPDALDGKARLKEVRIQYFDGKEGAFIDLLILLPKEAKGKVPVFLICNFGGNHRIHPSKDISLTKTWMSNKRGGVKGVATDASRGKWQKVYDIDGILASGYGLATYHCADTDPDRNNFKDGIHPYFYKEGQTKPAADEWGAISAWAWGLRRAMDYLETDQDIDSKKVAVLGHSRLGKAALWAGAQDERFGLVISNNSGCGGASLSRRRFGETVTRINNNFPFWFNDNFNQYSNNEDQLPVDQHMLLALVAPRPVYVASASEDLWADPRGEFLAAKHSQEVYKLFGYKEKLTECPQEDSPVMGRVGYHLRSGRHSLTTYDWRQYIKFANLHFNK